MDLSVRERLSRRLAGRRCTLLGVGTVSRTCVNAAVDLANAHEVPLILIASRRQVDTEEGYLEGWTAAQLARHVRDRDRKGMILLARDHGGPWQSPREVREALPVSGAMASAKASFAADLDAGFDLLHVDPSIDIRGPASERDRLQRAFEILEFCHAHGRRKGREVLYEVGTDEQTAEGQALDEFRGTVDRTLEFCRSGGIPAPAFFVAQTGTKVAGTRNIGSFQKACENGGGGETLSRLRDIVGFCNRSGVWLKEHNTDYLSDRALRLHPELGIHAANVAPEFAMTESRAFMGLCREFGRGDVLDSFIRLAVESRKWEKWLQPGSTATDVEKTTIAGHYVFSHPEFEGLKESIRAETDRRGLDLDSLLQQSVQQGILRYLVCFNLLGGGP